MLGSLRSHTAQVGSEFASSSFSLIVFGPKFQSFPIVVGLLLFFFLQVFFLLSFEAPGGGGVYITPCCARERTISHFLQCFISYWLEMLRELHSNILNSERRSVFFHWKNVIKTECVSVFYYLKWKRRFINWRFINCLETLKREKSLWVEVLLSWLK